MAQLVGWATGLLFFLSGCMTHPGSANPVLPATCATDGDLIEAFSQRELTKEEALTILSVMEQRSDAALDPLPGYLSCETLDTSVREVATSKQTVRTLHAAGMSARDYVTGLWMLAAIYQSHDALRARGFYEQPVVQRNMRLLESNPDIRARMAELAQR